MRSTARPLLTLAVLLAASGCATQPFGTSPRTGTTGAGGHGAGPVLTTPTEPIKPAPGAGGGPLEVPPPAPLPRERPHTPPATLSPATKALVGQAQAQRSKGDLPGATVSLERALRIEPSNPLLWIEMGRLRMDQRNYPQAEAMGRRALSMSVGDNRTQSLAWQLIADSLKARGRNPQAQEAQDRATSLSQQM